MSRARGLTLVEMLIIVIVLAILAAVVTPQLSRASGDSRLDAMRANLLDMRAQLRLYQSQHGGKFPSLGEFVTQMTQYSNAAGQTSATRTGTCNLGPYVLAVPGNPYSGGNRIGNGQPGTSDWFYDPATGLFRAKWSADVHEEWISALLEKRPDLTRDKLERTRALMDLHATTLSSLATRI